MICPIAPHADVPDFTPGITREIWENRGVGAKLDRCYAADCLVRPATGLASDDRDVEAQTLQTLHRFPGRQLVGEDVIWRGAADNTFPSSHRLISIMRHERAGDGRFGAPSGAPVHVMGLSHLQMHRGRVIREWIVADEAAVWKQILAHREAKAGADRR